MTPKVTIVESISQPEALLAASPREWEALLVAGRRHGISARWYERLRAVDALDRVPEAVRHHLEADARLASNCARMLRWETNRIRRALADADLDPVFLKGAAYAAAGLRVGTGRLASDVDILVGEADLARAEAALSQHGWVQQPHSDYDDKYFRQWMHELPPMRHGQRGTVVDVHHNLLPRTCRLAPPAAELIARAVTVGDGVRVLDPVDMTIHSVLHGFYNGEFTNCFRDVLDVYCLLAEFSATEGADFWERLTQRCAQFGVAVPACYAVRAARREFGLEIPPAATAWMESHRAPWPRRAMLHWAMDRAFLPVRPARLGERAALKLLRARSHWIKMPLPLLTRHLAYKSWLRLSRSQRPPAPSDVRPDAV